MSTERDVQAIKDLLLKWHQTRAWAEELLCLSLGLKDALQVLDLSGPKVGQLGDTPWHFRVHGLGVNISMAGNRGGIDFDFGMDEPDVFRLRDFLVKQLNAGALPKKIYRPLVQDHARFEAALRAL